MLTTNIFFLLTFYLSSTTTTITSTTTTHHHYHNRHLLHQPFFPQESFPPTQPPTSSPQPQPNQPTLPKYPFSTTPSTPQKPFFPTFPSPPPPPSITALATFPANISSLLFPHQTSSSSHRHVIAIAVSISLLSAAIIAAISAIFLYTRSTKRSKPIIPTTTTTTDKSSHSDSLRLFPPNTAPSDKPPLYTSTNNSSEFLYLGTLVNSRGEIETHNINNNTNTNTNTNTNSNKNNIANNIGVKLNISSSSSSTYQKLGSPELKPLPPLPRHNYSYTSGEVGINTNDEGDTEEEGEDEEFFSPRGSSGGKESPKRIGSSSRRDFQGIGGENFGSRSFNSRTASYPYSNSCSPSNSITTSPSPVRSVSPRSLNPKSPNSVVNFPAPPVAMKRSQSPISSSSSSSVNTQNSLDRISAVSLQNKQSPTTGFVPIKLPPPPPPPPPPRFWEMPVREQTWGPPILVAPSRPVVLQNLGPNFVNEQLQSSEAVERNEETPKPKLKPLHWDKVRASSDRAMVWDQIKSSSFQ